MTIVAAAELEDLAAGALRAAGLSAEGSADVAPVLVLADLFGIRTHGVARVPQYRAGLRDGIDLPDRDADAPRAIAGEAA